MPYSRWSKTIRQTAVRFRRESDAKAGAELDKLLKKLTRDQTNSVVRAFSYFSHLANIAEDQHHNRRRRTHALAVRRRNRAPWRMPCRVSTMPACPAIRYAIS